MYLSKRNFNFFCLVDDVNTHEIENGDEQQAYTGTSTESQDLSANKKRTRKTTIKRTNVQAIGRAQQSRENPFGFRPSAGDQIDYYLTGG